jgi:hypothetical protein
MLAIILVRLFWTNRGHQSVQGGLASLVAASRTWAKDLQRGQVGFFFQDLYNKIPEILDLAGSANPPLLSLSGVIDMNDGASSEMRLTERRETPARRATSALE